MNKSDLFLRVATYQGKIQEKQPQENLGKALAVAATAHHQGIDIVCLPECFLHGYFEDRQDAFEYSIDLSSAEFTQLCAQFAPYSPTIILGLNERSGDRLYNTAVVIENGKMIGKYRKAYTYEPYDYYTTGTDFPVFEKKGIKYSIIICYDSAFREPAFISALQGARVIFCPMFNRVSKDSIIINYLNRKSHFITRAFDNHCWFVSSDIVWGDEFDTTVCQGYATIVDSEGQVVAQSQPFVEMLVSYNIPIAKLEHKKQWRLHGKPELFFQAHKVYRSVTSAK